MQCNSSPRWLVISLLMAFYLAIPRLYVLARSVSNDFPIWCLFRFRFWTVTSSCGRLQLKQQSHRYFAPSLLAISQFLSDVSDRSTPPWASCWFKPSNVCSDRSSNPFGRLFPAPIRLVFPFVYLLIWSLNFFQNSNRNSLCVLQVLARVYLIWQPLLNGETPRVGSTPFCTFDS